MSLQDERTRDYLMNADPDELVDILGVSSQELIDAFPEKVRAYLEDEYDVEDDPEEDYDAPDY